MHKKVLSFYEDLLKILDLVDIYWDFLYNYQNGIISPFDVFNV